VAEWSNILIDVQQRVQKVTLKGIKRDKEGKIRIKKEVIEENLRWDIRGDIA